MRVLTLLLLLLGTFLSCSSVTRGKYIGILAPNRIILRCRMRLRTSGVSHKSVLRKCNELSKVSTENDKKYHPTQKTRPTTSPKTYKVINLSKKRRSRREQILQRLMRSWFKRRRFGRIPNM